MQFRHTLELKWHVFYEEGSMINELDQSVRTSSISFACISISLFMLVEHHDVDLCSLQKHTELSVFALLLRYAFNDRYELLKKYLGEAVYIQQLWKRDSKIK